MKKDCIDFAYDGVLAFPGSGTKRRRRPLFHPEKKAEKKEEVKQEVKGSSSAEAEQYHCLCSSRFYGCCEGCKRQYA